MVDWESPDLKDWRIKAKEEQQFFCDALGDRDYDAYGSDEVKYLDLKIGSAFYGPPKNVDENQNEVELSNYESDQQDFITKIRNLILTKTGKTEIRVAFIFLIVKQDSNHYQMPLIRLLDLNDKVFFIDHQVRLYEGWDNFKSQNLYPECVYCYPELGEYKSDENNNVIVGVSASPSCDLVQRAVKVVDTTSTVAMLGSLGVTVGSFFFPPMAVLLPAATYAGLGSGAYALGRNALKLNNMKDHEQSINPLTDSEARSCWFACVGGAFGMGSMGLLRYTTHLARNGEVACKAMRVAYSCFEGGNLTVSGLGIVSQIYDLSQKKEKISVMDYVSLSTQILFFTHSCVNLKRASTIIKEVQTSVLEDYGSSLSGKQKANFKKLVKNSVGEETMHGNAKVIKSLKHINNLEDFVKNTSAIQKRGGRNHDFKLTDDGNISINGQLDIHPDKMVTISRVSRKKIFECTKKLETNPGYAAQFKLDVKDICKNERINFVVTRKATLSRICSSFSVKDLSDVKVNGKKIFKDVQPHEIDRFGRVMNTSGQNYDEELLEIVKDFASKNKCENSTDFCSFVEFVSQYIRDESGCCTNVPKQQQFKEILAQLRNPETGRMDEMLRRFTEIKKEVSGLNATASVPFLTDNQATYHFYKHKDFRGEDLTPKDYFEMIGELFENKDLPRCSTLTQDGKQVRITITDPSTGAKGVIIKPTVSTNDCTVYAATFFYDSRVYNP